jgi:lipoprotein-anchoring transpeptidase ErfK/SrfK
VEEAVLKRTRTTIAILALLAGAAAFSPALAGATAAVVPATVAEPLLDVVDPGDTAVLSDEKTVTRWAHASELEPIRTAANAKAHSITRLRFLTEDGFPEVYLVLDAKVDPRGEPWLHIRIPMRPNGRTGWVPADMLGPLTTVRTQLIIDRTAKHARLYKAGRRIWDAPVGIGKAATPTPSGKFYIREKLAGGGGVYGPWAFGTSAYSRLSDWKKGGVVGIHGTNEPNLVPGRPSHGCVRVRNDKVSQLARLMPIGTPVSIVR